MEWHRSFYLISLSLSGWFPHLLPLLCSSKHLNLGTTCKTTDLLFSHFLKVDKPASARDAISACGSLPRPTSTRFISYEELKEATDNFNPSCMLGEGGFGRVFKGVLNDGTAVAIKKLTNGGHQGDKEFLVEVEMLSRLHHRNLVKLIGYYSSRDSTQNLLCYELIPNGSLEAWLHGTKF
jgi:Protein tyrosine and serine/threonine kinase